MFARPVPTTRLILLRVLAWLRKIVNRDSVTSGFAPLWLNGSRETSNGNTPLTLPVNLTCWMEAEAS